MGAFFAPLIALFSAGVRWVFGFFSGSFLGSLGTGFSLVAMIAIFVSLTDVFISGVYFFVSSYFVSVPERLVSVFGCVLPSNFVPCVSALVSARILSLLYSLKLMYFVHTVRTAVTAVFSRVWSAIIGRGTL